MHMVVGCLASDCQFLPTDRYPEPRIGGLSDPTIPPRMTNKLVQQFAPSA